MFIPIFVDRNGNYFITMYSDHRSEDESEAFRIGFGVSIVEGILLGFKFTNECLEVTKETQLQYAKGKLGVLEVALLYGPEFDSLEQPAAWENVRKYVPNEKP
jgi:hypothetical protein